jgi:hypothetical protein
MGVILARHFRTSRWQEHESANRLGKRRAKFMSGIRVATLLHRRLGYDRLLNGEVPAIVYLDEDGRLFSAPVFDDAARTLRFKLVSTGMRGATYSLLLHDCGFQFTVSHTDGTSYSLKTASSARRTPRCCRSFFDTWRQLPKGPWCADARPTTRFGSGFSDGSACRKL